MTVCADSVLDSSKLERWCGGMLNSMVGEQGTPLIGGSTSLSRSQDVGIMLKRGISIDQCLEEMQ